MAIPRKPVPSIYIKQLGGSQETQLKPIKELKALTNKSETAGGRQAKEGGGWRPKRQGFQHLLQLRARLCLAGGPGSGGCHR